MPATRPVITDHQPAATAASTTAVHHHVCTTSTVPAASQSWGGGPPGPFQGHQFFQKQLLSYVLLFIIPVPDTKKFNTNTHTQHQKKKTIQSPTLTPSLQLIK